MGKRKYYTIGSYTPEKGDADAVIERGATEQGYVFKDERAFVKYKRKVCYIPELHDGGYTRQDFLDMCGGNEVVAAELFDMVDWQSPETLLEEWFQHGENEKCEKCGYVFNIYRYENQPPVVACPKCGTALETEEEKPMQAFASMEQVAELRKQYTEGLRVELIKMDDPYTKLRAGDRGTVDFVDDAGNIHVLWDNGSSLGVIWGVDIIKIAEDGQ